VDVGTCDLTAKADRRSVGCEVSSNATPKWVLDKIETFLRKKPWGRIEIKVKAGQVTDLELTENVKESSAG
jgi:hypothetical protein